MGDQTNKEPCKYGISCYQRNKIHLEKYKHPMKMQDETSEETPSKKCKTDKDRDESSASSVEQGKNTSTPAKKVVEVKQTESNNVPADQVLLKNKIRTNNSKKLVLPSNHNALIKRLFLVDMPNDFYSFWEMCKSLEKSDPINALKAIKLKLVGPFDVLAGNVSEVYEEDLPDLLRHWRFYYDPPEFQTVIVKEGSSCFHFGYHRDDPKQEPVFVASNELNPKKPWKNGDLTIVAANLFAALNCYLEELKTDPFSRMKVPKFQKALTSWANEKGFSLGKEVKSRKIVARTFHGAGIVVPLEEKYNIGYRQLSAPNCSLKGFLEGIVESKTEAERKPYWEELQTVITFASIANDEGDFGANLELGLDLFTYGSPLLHKTILQVLPTAYNLLGRPEFSKIIEAHLKNRRQGNNLSVL